MRRILLGLMAVAALWCCAHVQRPAPPSGREDIRIEVESSVLDLQGHDGGVQHRKTERRVQAAFARVVFGSSAVHACTEEGRLSGTGSIKLQVAVEASGDVSNVAPFVSGPLMPAAECLSRALSTLKFPRSTGPHQFDFDFVAY